MHSSSSTTATTYDVSALDEQSITYSDHVGCHNIVALIHDNQADIQATSCDTDSSCHWRLSGGTLSLDGDKLKVSESQVSTSCLQEGVSCTVVITGTLTREKQ